MKSNRRKLKRNIKIMHNSGGKRRPLYKRLFIDNISINDKLPDGSFIQR